MRNLVIILALAILMSACADAGYVDPAQMVAQGAALQQLGGTAYAEQARAYGQATLDAGRAIGTQQAQAIQATMKADANASNIAGTQSAATAVAAGATAGAVQAQATQDAQTRGIALDTAVESAKLEREALAAQIRRQQDWDNFWNDASKWFIRILILGLALSVIAALVEFIVYAEQIRAARVGGIKALADRDRIVDTSTGGALADGANSRLLSASAMVTAQLPKNHAPINGNHAGYAPSAPQANPQDENRKQLPAEVVEACNLLVDSMTYYGKDSQSEKDIPRWGKLELIDSEFKSSGKWSKVTDWMAENGYVDKQPNKYTRVIGGSIQDLYLFLMFDKPMPTPTPQVQVSEMTHGTVQNG